MSIDGISLPCPLCGSPLPSELGARGIAQHLAQHESVRECFAQATNADGLRQDQFFVGALAAAAAAARVVDPLARLSSGAAQHARPGAGGFSPLGNNNNISPPAGLGGLGFPTIGAGGSPQQGGLQGFRPPTGTGFGGGLGGGGLMPQPAFGAGAGLKFGNAHKNKPAFGAGLNDNNAEEDADAFDYAPAAPRPVVAWGTVFGNPHPRGWNNQAGPFAATPGPVAAVIALCSESLPIDISAREEFLADQMERYHKITADVDQKSLLATLEAPSKEWETYNDTSLCRACLCGNEVLVQELLATGANALQPGNGARTPAHYAAKSGNVEILELLVNEHNADLELLDSNGRSVLDFARGTPCEAFVEDVLQPFTKVKAAHKR
jgi:Ankyrin repeats (3 copies)